jgi:hypothetical protein
VKFSIDLHSNQFSKEPDDEEIHNIVFHMRKEKSPGMDGLTAESLQLCLDFIGEACCKVVRSFWKHGNLPKQMLAAVTKLIYKGDESFLVKKWCSISFLNVPYKLIAKVIAKVSASGIGQTPADRICC